MGEIRFISKYYLVDPYEEKEIRSIRRRERWEKERKEERERERKGE